MNSNAEAQAIHIKAPGTVAGESKVEAIVSNFEDENTLDDPMKVAPKAQSVQVAGAELDRELPAHSVTVMRLKTR